MLGKGGTKKEDSSSNSSQAASKENVRIASNLDINNAIESLRGGTGEGQNGAGNQTIPERIKTKPKVLGGAKSLGGKYLKKGVGAIVGAGTSASGAVLGFSAGLAQGDVSKAFAGAIAGGKAGKAVAQRISNGINVDNIKNSINEIKDTFNEGAYGTEKAQELKEIREFKSTSAYKELKEKYKDILTDDKLGEILKAGITEKSDIDKVLKSDNTKDAIGYYTLAKSCPDDIYYNKEYLKEYVEDLAEQVGLSRTDANKIIENMKKFR